MVHKWKINTTGDGACSIHSVWGHWVSGALFMRDARSFLRVSFGKTAEEFQSRLCCADLMIEIEVALWDMLAPIVKQLGHLDMPPRTGDNEGRLVWHCWLESSRDVAQRCFDAGRADMEKFRIYRECKERVIQEFGCLCVSAFEDVFIMPLMTSLGLLEKYMGELSLEVAEGRRLSKYETLFAGSAGARE